MRIAELCSGTRQSQGGRHLALPAFGSDDAVDRSPAAQPGWPRTGQVVADAEP